MPSLNQTTDSSPKRATKFCSASLLKSFTRKKEFEEYSRVRLTTDKYKHLGLSKGEVGTIVDIYRKHPVGYTVEFHKVPASNFHKVETFEYKEIELVKDENKTA